MERTSEECLQRMETFVRKCNDLCMKESEHSPFIGKATYDEEVSLMNEARAIVAELDAVNGPQTDEERAENDEPSSDIAWAERIEDDLFGSGRLALALACIAKGRELAGTERKVIITNYNPSRIEVVCNSDATEVSVLLKPFGKLGNANAR